jgi:regulator of sigma E protease
MSAMSDFTTLLLAQTSGWLGASLSFLKVLAGFSIIIFVHELGHFLAAKWVGVRVDRFAVGFGYRLFGWRRGEGLTLGRRPDYNADQLRARGYGETDYCFKLLPLGGYVRMLGQDDIVVDDKSGNIQLGNDPRAFTNRSVGERMFIASAGVVFNLIFAALALMTIFLVGKEALAPRIGIVPADSPANGVLFTGDEVLEINGSPVHSFDDIVAAPIFSNQTLRLKVRRDGQILDDLFVEPVESPRIRLPSLEVTPSVSPRLASDWEPVLVPAEEVPEGVSAVEEPSGLRRLPHLKTQDRITHVNGQPIDSILDVERAFQLSRGKLVHLTAERRDPNRPDQPPETVHAYHRALLTWLPTSPPGERPGRATDPDLLGLYRLSSIARKLAPGTPAAQAGLKAGDVILEWGTIAYPLYTEILASIPAHENQPIRVVVERDGQRVGPLTVIPRRRMLSLWRSEVKIQADVYPSGDGRPIVADVAGNSPAAALRLPRGALLLSIDGQQVTRWTEVTELLRQATGRDVAVRYRVGTEEVTDTMSVPSSIVDVLQLPPTARIWKVNGKSSVMMRDARGRSAQAELSDNPWALREALRAFVGREVTVEYSFERSGPLRSAEVLVQADMVDPWQMRVSYVLDGFSFQWEKTRLHAHGNPVRALSMGVQEVWGWVLQVYYSLHMVLFRQNVGFEHVAGPVGIFNIAMEHARIGFIDLLYFMALISVNLAVINFLPVPIMDGGLMLFLIIEKLKGKPLSIRTQMITTLISLATLVLVGILVTVQDIGRIFS